MRTIHGVSTQGGAHIMDNVYSYIDRCLIEEYGTPNHELNSFDLDIDDVPEKEISNVLDRLMKEDCSLRETVHIYIQQLIDKRLREVTLC